MHRNTSKSPHGLLLTAGATLLLASSASAQVPKKIDVAFAARAGGKPVACGTAIPGLGAKGQAAQLRDLRFYVSDVKLLRGHRRSVPVRLARSSFGVTRSGGAVTLIDLENGRGSCAEEGTKVTNAHVRGSVPAGRYTGLSFTVGVPSALNHSDIAGAPAPLNLAAMGWSWQVGRKFLKVETSDPVFMVHLGSTGCTGNPAGAHVTCTSSNRVRVRMPSFDASRQKVAVDVKALLAGSDLSAGTEPMNGMGGGAGGMGSPSATGGTARAASMDMGMDEMSGCMSGPGEKGCGPVFKALGLKWNDTSGGGAASASKQTVFRATAR